jgi:3-deoxy-D-manno-octulosonic-acid transferase
MRRLVAAWRPRLLVFFKFDCWPGQILAAREAGVPVVLLAGTLQPGSARLWPGVRAFFRDLFDRFAQLGVCTAEDRERFVSGLGVRCPVTVTGDTRAEQVILRYEAAADGSVASRLRAWASTLLVLGSTWPRDERLWLPVLPELLAEFTNLRLVLVPHEPLPARLAHLARDLDRRGIATILLSQLMAGAAESSRARCVLVDSVGVLAEIYRAGTLAYVGGSFTSGVHNTMEPAICGLPVLFGPVIQNAMEAGVLREKGGGFVVHQPAEAAVRTRALLGDRAALTRCGAAARQVVLAQRGATEKSLAVLRPYL